MSLSGYLATPPETPTEQKYAHSTKSAKSTVDVGCIKVLRGLRDGGEGMVTGCCRVSLDGHLKNPQDPPGGKKYANSTKSANSAMQAGCIKVSRGLRVVVKE